MTVRALRHAWLVIACCMTLPSFAAETVSASTPGQHAGAEPGRRPTAAAGLRAPRQPASRPPAIIVPSQTHAELRANPERTHTLLARSYRLPTPRAMQNARGPVAQVRSVHSSGLTASSSALAGMRTPKLHLAGGPSSVAKPVVNDGAHKATSVGTHPAAAAIGGSSPHGTLKVGIGGQVRHNP